MLGMEVATYIVANTTTFQLGYASTNANTPLWLNRFPPHGPDTALALYETGGAGPLYTQSGVMAIERPTVQVLSRSTSYATARSNAETIYQLLGFVTNESLLKASSSTDVTPYLTITPLQSPTDIGQDSDERDLVTCNYMVEKGLS